jgi:hypothetical protein
MSHLDDGWQIFPMPNFRGLQELVSSSDKGIYGEGTVSDTITSNKRSDYANTPTLIVDIDGCLANWNDAFYDLLVRLHGLPYPDAVGEYATRERQRPLFRTWNWPKTECGYTNQEIDAAWDRVDDIWWNMLKPYDGVEDALERLHWLDYRRKAQVVFCTGRYPSARSASENWLYNHGYPGAHVITTSKKLHIAHAHAANGPVSVIEDKPTLLEQYLGGPLDTVYCIDQPYNQDVRQKERPHFGPKVPAEFIRLTSAKAAAIDYEKKVTKQ